MEETDGAGTAIWLHGYGLTEIGRMTWKGGYTFACEDSVGYGCAAPAGIRAGAPNTFKLFVRKSMYEFYLNGLLVQTMNTTHFPDAAGINPGKIGFAVKNGICDIQNLSIRWMNL